LAHRPSCAAIWLRWGRAEAVSGFASPDEAPGTCGRVPDLEQYNERILDPYLDIDENSVMGFAELRPKGYPGMARSATWAYLKLLARGITDMVADLDARMSGTAYAPWFCTVPGSGGWWAARSGS